MTPYELAYLAAEPGLPVLHGQVRADLSSLIGRGEEPARLLDVGGRRSNYTIGLPARVTVLDLPRESDLQHALNLGLTDELQEHLRRRRSNVDEVVVQDMTRSTLPSASFDVAVAVEVIEHVPEDGLFVEQLRRVLRPGGFAYLTTPNGDHLRDPAIDHVRHYRRTALEELLRSAFDEVVVTWGIRLGEQRSRGLGLVQGPLHLPAMVLGNLRNRRESRHLAFEPHRTAHLFAIARVAS